MIGSERDDAGRGSPHESQYAARHRPHRKGRVCSYALCESHDLFDTVSQQHRELDRAEILFGEAIQNFLFFWFVIVQREKILLISYKKPLKVLIKPLKGVRMSKVLSHIRQTVLTLGKFRKIFDFSRTPMRSIGRVLCCWRQRSENVLARGDANLLFYFVSLLQRENAFFF